MLQDVKNICQLLTSDNPENVAVALQILKGNAALKEKVTKYFQPILDASNKKTIDAVPSILEQLKQGKGTLKARLQIGTVPEIHHSIESLYLNGQKLDNLPNWVRNLSNLKTLALCSCDLKKIPDWIEELKHLTYLSIADNQIENIPDSFGNLLNLKNCYIVENNIKILPDSIKNLVNLKNFYVKKGNRISEDEIRRIKQVLPQTTVH